MMGWACSSADGDKKSISNFGGEPLVNVPPLGRPRICDESGK